MTIKLNIREAYDRLELKFIPKCFIDLSFLRNEQTGLGNISQPLVFLF